LSAQTLTYVAGVIRRHRKKTGSCWRKLSPGRQALLVLAYLRKGETFAGLAAGFGVGTATAWRYVDETVALLAARSPNLRRAPAEAAKAGHAYVVIDGTPIPIDRVAADRPFYSGKHRRHGMNLQVISSPIGDILWVSGPLPGAVHDLTAARICGIARELAAAGLVVLADKGYIGAGEHVHTPYRGRNKPASQKAANRAHAQLRPPGERANAHLKTSHILRKLRCCPWKAGQLAKAIHVLQAREIAGLVVALVLTPDPVDGLAAGGGSQPRAGVGQYAVGRPPLHGGRERLAAASSAMSRSPKRLVRAAITRAHSSWRARVTASSTSLTGTAAPRSSDRRSSTPRWRA
jgi:DDE superfamily endonuclease/Helix-turn-helix of DDE superfamily endonuclease